MDEQDHNSKPLGINIFQNWTSSKQAIYASGWMPATGLFSDKEYKYIYCEYCGARTVISKNTLCACGCPLLFKNGEKAKLESLYEYKINYTYYTYPPSAMNPYVSLNIK